MRNIAILGSTGSIGVNALDVVSRLKSRFNVVALSADTNIKLLSGQARVFRPKVVSVGTGELAGRIKRSLPPGTDVVTGPCGLAEIVSRQDVDLVVFAISGALCVIPLLEAIRRKKAIALANKESLVTAGDIVMAAARSSGVKIIPIDSEHSAVFQCLEGRPRCLSKIYLTGSGGPLLDVPAGRFDRLPRSAILRHPKWRMGRKISVDSATMMNKGLEVIEAKHLFGVSEDSIEVLIHPEAVIHSMVELVDGSVLAQLGAPDMRLPIQYAMTYPERYAAPARRIDFGSIGALSFRKPDARKFPCLGLALAASRKGGTAPSVLNAADEEAVKAYLGGKIKFSAIAMVIEKVLARHRDVKTRSFTIDDVLDADSWAREETKSLCYH